MPRKPKNLDSTEQVSKVNKATYTPDNQPDRFKMSEMAYSGLNVWNGVSDEEMKRELNFPNNLRVYKQMTYHSAVNSALSLYDNLVRKTKWVVNEPKDATATEKKRTEFIRQCMKDMEHSWEDFISECMSMNVYGFSIQEKVYRRRLNSNGSLYNDGLIGWKKLPIRNQRTIEKFIFVEDGNDIVGVKQNLNNIVTNYTQSSAILDPIKRMPRNKFLLMRTGRHNGNPYGVSPLRDAYVSWRYLTAIEEIESNGVAKDVSGLPVLRIPSQYLSADASPEQVAIKNYFINALRNIQVNQQSGVLLPQAFDVDSGKPLFDLQLLSLDGKKAFDTTKVKEYYKNAIYTSLFADLLILGQSSTGSFALGTLKNSMTGAAIHSMLVTIRNELNRDLIRQTYELNNWDTSRMCEFDFDGLEAVDLESLSKAIQRYASTSVLEVDREVLNVIRESIGADPLPVDEEPREEYMPNFSSRSGDGMATAGEGTATTVTGTDTSSNNLENKG